MFDLGQAIVSGISDIVDRRVSVAPYCGYCERKEKMQSIIKCLLGHRSYPDDTELEGGLQTSWPHNPHAGETRGEARWRHRKDKLKGGLLSGIMALALGVAGGVGALWVQRMLGW